MDREIVSSTNRLQFSPRQRITADVKLFLDGLAARLLVDRKAAASKLGEQRGFSRARVARKNDEFVGLALNERRLISGFDLIPTKHCSLPGGGLGFRDMIYHRQPACGRTRR